MVSLAAMLVCAPALSVWADKGDLKTLQTSATAIGGTTHTPLNISFGKAELIDIEGDVADVLVANPNLVDVTAVQARRLYVVGLNVGDTNLIALDEAGNVIQRFDIHIKYDLDAIQTLVNELFPGEDIKVGSIHDQILVSGTVTTPDASSRVTSIIGGYVSDLQNKEGTADELIVNLLKVRGEQQVTLQVKIVEASRNVIKELGINTNANDTDELSAIELFGNSPPGSIADRGAAGLFRTGAGIALTQDSTGILSLLHDTGIEGIGTLNVVLEALEDEDLVNILAEPNLTAVSGEQAGFLAGGEFPVPVGRDQVGNLVIEFREFGVSLNFRPTVLSNDRIALQMNTEVSSLDFDNAIVLSDVTVPGLDVRKAETSVEVPSGGSLMIAGLLQSKAIKGMAGLPGIKNTPILGKLVSSDSFQREETELLVFVTPYLVAPYAEKTYAKQVSENAGKPLAAAFVKNIKRAFDIDEDEIFAGIEPYGYILD